MEMLSVRPEPDYEINSTGFEDSFPATLATDKVALAAFLSAISEVELFGAKWIVAVPHRYWNEELHGHALDEIRHGKLAQDAARELRADFTDAEIVREARLSLEMHKLTETYLSSLSLRSFRPVRKRLGADWFEPAYVLLSFLIERRLMKIYPHLARIAATEGVRLLARNLIADEKEHLSQINAKLADRLELSGARKDELVQLEQSLAKQWLEGAANAANASA
jgi:hypothetical protein